MKFSDKFTLTGDAPLAGGMGGVWMKAKFQEVADAETAGVGPSIPDDNGTPTPGTVKAGTLCELNSNGNMDKATQATLGTNMPKLYMVAFAGNTDYSGAYVGTVSFVTGCRLETTVFDSAVYAKGAPLVPSPTTAGNWSPKVSASDNIQGVGFVGPKGVADGVLDVIMLQGSGI